MTDQPADLIIVAHAVHTMAGDASPVAALAVRDGKIAATAGPFPAPREAGSMQPPI